MSRVKRQREALISGFGKVTVPVPSAIMTPSITEIPVPGLSAPLDLTGTLRNAPTPFLSLWAGIRLAVDLSPARLGSNYETWFETGLQPYSQRNEAPGRAPLRPMFGAFGNGTSPGPFDNLFQMHTLLPWPPGGLVVRVSFQRTAGGNELGAEVDIAVAWSVNTQAAYFDLPAIQDLVDL